MTAAELLTSLAAQGFQMVPLGADKLGVRPASKLTDELREALKQKKAEVLALLSFPAWPCPSCGSQVRLEAQDQYAPTRFWTCTTCPTWGATREGAVAPAVWVTNSPMQ
jgi:rubrerythrin